MAWAAGCVWSWVIVLEYLFSSFDMNVFFLLCYKIKEPAFLEAGRYIVLFNMLYQPPFRPGIMTTTTTKVIASSVTILFIPVLNMRFVVTTNVLPPGEKTKNFFILMQTFAASFALHRITGPCRAPTCDIR